MICEVIVVGGGIGGLTTAALLAARGLRVCLFERQSEVGGCVANFEHLGYTFEPTAGLYSGWESGGAWERIFSELSGPPPIVSKLTPSYTVRMPDGRDIAVGGDQVRFENEIANAFPDDARDAINFFQRLEGSREGRNNEMVATRLTTLSAEFRLFIDVQLQTLAHRTSADCSVTSAAAVLGATQAGLWEIGGGAQALADRLADSFKQSGGTLRLNSPVLRLAYANDGQPIGIDLLTGERVLASRAIISNLTIWDTFGKLVGLSRTPRPISAELKKMEAWGAYLLFLGLDEAASKNLRANRMLIVTGASDGDFAPDCQQLILNAQRGGGPAGKRAVTVSSFTHAEDWFGFHEDETSHETQDQAALESCWARLHAAMPELGDSVEVIETATPRTFYESGRRKFGMVGPPHGRFDLIDTREGFGKTPFANTFIVGDTVSPPFGLEGIAQSARALADFLAPVEAMHSNRDG